MNITERFNDIKEKIKGSKLYKKITENKQKIYKGIKTGIVIVSILALLVVNGLLLHKLDIATSVKVTEVPISTEVVTSIPVEEPTATIAPTQGLVSNIPDAIYTFPCYNSTRYSCIEEGDSLQDIVTHVIYTEGGSISLQASADILQVLANRVYSAWSCSMRLSCSNPAWATLNPSKIDWSEIDRPTFEKLVLYILSQPYTGIDGIDYPAFNGWSLPLNVAAMERNELSSRMYDAEYEMVGKWLSEGMGAPIDDCGIELIYTDSNGVSHKYAPHDGVKDVGVQYFYSTINHLPTFPIVACDYVDSVRYVSNDDTTITTIRERINICFTYQSGYNEDDVK